MDKRFPKMRPAFVDKRNICPLSLAQLLSELRRKFEAACAAANDHNFRYGWNIFKLLRLWRRLARLSLPQYSLRP